MRKFDTRTLTGCALMIALQVIMARFIMPNPNVTTRISIEAVPVFIAGMLYGPIPGALVGLAGDAIGCLFSPYGFNPIFCVPPILYGLTGGFFNPEFGEKCRMWHFAVGYLPPVIIGSILYQSAALAYVYGHGAFIARFYAQLSSRVVLFAIIYALDVLVTYVICRANFLEPLMPMRGRHDD